MTDCVADEFEGFLIGVYAEVARPIMRACGLVVNSCITATRITQEVFALWGIPVVPVATKLVIQCREKKFAFLAGFDAGEKADARRKATRWWDRGVEEPGWDGHLVGVVRDRWLIDCTLDQATCEESGVEIPSGVIAIDMGDEGRKFRTGGAEAKFILDDGTSLEITWDTTDRTDYMDTDAWRDEGATLLAVKIVMEMRLRVRAIRRAGRA